MPQTVETFTVNALADMLGHDRRSMKRWLVDLPPAGMRDGNPVYSLEAVRAAVKRHLERKNTTKTARDKLLTLQAEKVELQIAAMRGEFVHAEDVEQWGGELGAGIRKVVTQIHLCAPSVVGLSVADAEQRLKELEDEILEQLHLLDNHIAQARHVSAAMTSLTE